MTLRMKLCTTCGQPMECSNAPHTFCANSHTHKQHLQKTNSLIKLIVEIRRRRPDGPDCDFLDSESHFLKNTYTPIKGAYWSAVDALCELQESQLLEEANGEGLDLTQELPLLFPTRTTENT